jgi:hypothetical protein
VEPHIFVPTVLDEFLIYIGLVQDANVCLRMHWARAWYGLSTLSLPTYIKADGETVLEEK